MCDDDSGGEGEVWVWEEEEGEGEREAGTLLKHPTTSSQASPDFLQALGHYHHCLLYLP